MAKKPLSPAQKLLKAEKQRAYYATRKELERQNARTKRAADPQKYKAIRKAAYDKDPTKAKARARKWYRENRLHALAMAKAYRAANQDLVRLRRRRAAYGITPDQFADLWDSQNGKCAICNSVLSEVNRKNTC